MRTTSLNMLLATLTLAACGQVDQAQATDQPSAEEISIDNANGSTSDALTLAAGHSIYQAINAKRAAPVSPASYVSIPPVNYAEDLASAANTQAGYCDLRNGTNTLSDIVTRADYTGVVDRWMSYDYDFGSDSCPTGDCGGRRILMRSGHHKVACATTTCSQVTGRTGRSTIYSTPVTVVSCAFGGGLSQGRPYSGVASTTGYLTPAQEQQMVAKVADLRAPTSYAPVTWSPALAAAAKEAAAMCQRHSWPATPQFWTQANPGQTIPALFTVLPLVTAGQDQTPEQVVQTFHESPVALGQTPIFYRPNVTAFGCARTSCDSVQLADGSNWVPSASTHAMWVCAFNTYGP